MKVGEGTRVGASVPTRGALTFVAPAKVGTRRRHGRVDSHCAAACAGVRLGKGDWRTGHE